MKMSDIRWFSDNRPVCVIENEIKKKVGARDDYEYAEQLQTNKGQEVFKEQVRKVPQVDVTIKQ